MPRPAERRKQPRRLAVIDRINCTGCEACCEVCPVDCIDLRTEGLGVMGQGRWCEIDLARCIGCELCIRLPRPRDDPFQLTICPWDAIEMVPASASEACS